MTADEMKKCVWVRPEFVAQIEFLEWTEADISDIRSLSACGKIRTPARLSKSTVEKRDFGMHPH